MIDDVTTIWGELSDIQKYVSAGVAATAAVLTLWHQCLKIQKARIDIRKEKKEPEVDTNSFASEKINYAESPSNYDLCNESASEVYRLKFQADRIHDFDTECLDEIRELLEISAPNVVDLGCADGYLTFGRFGDRAKWGKIFGLDKHASSIKIANTVHKKGFSFFEFDLVEHAGKDSKLSLWVDGTKINLMFSALTLHHLGIPNQEKVLEYLWNQLSSPGCLAVRTFDDGFKITCPDYASLANELIEISATFPGAEDRYHGRKIYSQMLSACKDSSKIGTKYFIKDTVGMNKQDKEKFYQYAYGFRTERVKRALEINPDNIKLKKLYARAKEVDNKLRRAFVEENDFYTASSETFIYAIKK